jgi:DHA1 family tetracycline resistance protein-like MFS transporter
MTNLFAYFTATNAPVYFPGAPYLLGAALTLVSAGLAWRGFRNSRLVADKESALYQPDEQSGT